MLQRGVGGADNLPSFCREASYRLCPTGARRLGPSSSESPWMCCATSPTKHAVTGDYSWLVFTIAAVLVPMLLTALVLPAGVSSRCNRVLDQLNDELRCLGDGSVHSRVFPLECYLKNGNRGQGIGFKVFSLVVDRRALKQLALAIGGCLATGDRQHRMPRQKRPRCTALHSQQCGLDKAKRLYSCTSRRRRRCRSM